LIEWPGVGSFASCCTGDVAGDIGVVRQMLDAFNRGDVPAVIAAFDENSELDEPPETPDGPAPGFPGHDASVSGWRTCGKPPRFSSSQ
jgi:hypothetical protein